MSSDVHMNKRIKQAQLQKVPYQLVIGQKEVETNTVSVRLRTNEDKGSISVDTFIANVKKLVETIDNNNIWLD